MHYIFHTGSYTKFWFSQNLILQFGAKIARKEFVEIYSTKISALKTVALYVHKNTQYIPMEILQQAYLQKMPLKHSIKIKGNDI